MQAIQVIDVKHAHNVSIQLTSLRKPLLELCQALWDLNEVELNDDVLQLMHRTLPKEDDVNKLKQYTGDMVQLSDIEK